MGSKAERVARIKTVKTQVASFDKKTDKAWMELNGLETVISMDARRYEVLWRFWFGDLLDSRDYFDEQMDRWFGKQPGFDEEVAQKFSDWYESLENGDLEDWKKYPRGKVSLILLCDQISRHVFRGSPQAFRYDRIAREIATQICDQGLDESYSLAERIFIYLPFEHSERKDHQEKSVALFQKLFNEACPSLRKIFQETLNYALVHQDLIERFGRFPHRNLVLGRTSSPEELEYLKNSVL